MKGYSPKLPLTLDPRDGYRLNRTLQEVIKQNLKMLVLTNPGERVMVPDFGVGITSYLFENFNNVTYSNIEADIREQAGKYLPVVAIQRVLFDNSSEDNITLSVAIVYSIPALNVKDLLEFTI